MTAITLSIFFFFLVVNDLQMKNNLEWWKKKKSDRFNARHNWQQMQTRQRANIHFKYGKIDKPDNEGYYPGFPNPTL